MYIHIYIYIYTYVERERDRCIPFVSALPARRAVQTLGRQGAAGVSRGHRKRPHPQKSDLVR